MMNREFKDSGIEWIGKIPREWKTSLLSTLFYEHSRKNSGVKETNLLSLSYGRIIRKNINDNGGLLPESFEGYNVIAPNDIVFRLTDLQNDKRSLRTGLCKEKGIITSAYTTLRRRDNENDARYYHYLFHSCDECKIFYGIGNGVRQSMNYQDLRKLSVIIPPLPEQQRIADYLDKKCSEIDKLIALQEQMIAQLTDYKQSVITEAVTKGLNPNAQLVPSGLDWIGDVPEGWKTNKTNRLFKIIGSGTTPNSSDDDAYNGTINWIQSGDINGGILCESKNKISQSTLSKYSALTMYKAPFIIVAMYGASVGNISISEIDGCVNQACCVLSNSNIDFKYAFYAIKSAQRYLIYRAVGGGQPNISQNTLRQLWIPEPPLNEQRAIATFLDTKCSEIDSLISLKQQKIETLKDYKKSVIYEAVTGKTIICETP